VTEQCELVVGCDCDPPFYAAVDDCIEDLLGELLSLAELALSQGLAWNPDCAQAKLERVEAMCAPMLDPGPHCKGLYCELFAGDLRELQPCTPLEEVGSNCAPGLGCPRLEGQDVCVQVCGELLQGIECFHLGSSCADGLVCTAHGIGFPPPPTCGPAAEEGQGCHDVLAPVCAPALLCGPEQTCVPEPEPGEPCVVDQCGYTTFCNEQGICELPRANGEPCSFNGQCQSRYCPSGVCEALPAEGEPCPQTGTCAPGLACDPDSGTCQVAPPYLCKNWDPP
jgi:hypothetical protein